MDLKFKILTITYLIKKSGCQYIDDNRCIGLKKMLFHRLTIT
jgi:hypothetical protein